MKEFFKTDAMAGLILALIMVIAASPVYAQTEGIATIDSFKGEVIAEIRGIWRKNPEKGSAVHHGDKIVTTRDSSVHLRFNDGSSLDISSNSDVRVTQPLQRDVFAEKELGRREIRVFIGKITYKSGEGKSVETRMVSPTAVAVLRGTIVEFGTDGNYSYLNRIEGNTGNKGNITEGHVPDITPEQAAKNSNYQMSSETWNIWQKYEQAKKALAPDANILYAEVVKKISESLVVENTSLENNPDDLVKTRAVNALKKAQDAVQRADDALKTVKQFQQREKELAQKAQNQLENKQTSDLLIKAAVQMQEAIRDVVEGSTQIADAYTAAIYDSKVVQELERTTLRNLEVALELAKSAEKQVGHLVAKAAASNDPNVISVSLQTAEIMISAIEANAAVTDVAAKVIESTFDGNIGETQQLNQSLTKTMEIAGNVSDKKLQAETVVEKVEKSSENISQAVETLSNIEAEVNKELKSLPLPPKSEVIPPTTSATQIKHGAAVQPAVIQTVETSSETTTSAGESQASGSGTAPATSGSTGTTSAATPSPEPTLTQSPPPLQDANKSTGSKGYGQ